MKQDKKTHKEKTYSIENITYHHCYCALLRIKDKFGEGIFQNYRNILTYVMEAKGIFKSIDDKDALRRILSDEEIKNIDLSTGIGNLKLHQLINQMDFCYARTDRIFFFDNNKKIIPYSHQTYFLFLTICLNNFSDDSVKKILAHQYSTYPNKKEFLHTLRVNVREHAGKIIPSHKAETVMEWIEVKNKTQSSSTKLKKAPAIKESPERIDNKRDGLQRTLLDFLNRNRNLFSFIIKNYSNASPKNLAYLIFALNELSVNGESLLSDKIENINQTELYEALKNELGDIGVRASLNAQINIIKNKNRRGDEAKIKTDKLRITSLLLPLNSPSK
ncbi:MAG: hypothetical protein HY841_13860 [Bacteroidetes bacterium]|nr:hypothetical protein [Bacteroidota bacterium]